MARSEDPEDWPRRVAGERDYLLRYARLQLRDREAAEDVVQETLAAALAGRGGFGGRSSLRTWLTGILKHKIIDVIRRSSRETHVGEGVVDDEALDDALFDESGHWREPPQAWDSPDAALERGEFMAVLELCLGQLPAKTAQVFMMREHIGCETDEICKELGIRPTHCWVLLHRARMALRLCLENRWFGPIRKADA